MTSYKVAAAISQLCLVEPTQATPGSSLTTGACSGGKIPIPSTPGRIEGNGWNSELLERVYELLLGMFDRPLVAVAHDGKIPIAKLE